MSEKKKFGLWLLYIALAIFVYAATNPVIGCVFTFICGIAWLLIVEG